MKYLKKYESFDSKVWLEEDGPFYFDKTNLLSDRETKYLENFVFLTEGFSYIRKDDGIYYVKISNKRYLCTENLKLVPNLCIYEMLSSRHGDYEYFEIEKLGLYTPQETFLDLLRTEYTYYGSTEIKETILLLNNKEIYKKSLRCRDLINELSDIPILDEELVIESIKVNMKKYLEQIPKDMFTENVCVEIFNQYKPPYNWRTYTSNILNHIPFEKLTKKSLSILAEKCPNAIFLVDVRSSGFNEVVIKTLNSNRVGGYINRSPSILSIDTIDVWIDNLSDAEKKFISKELSKIIMERLRKKI